MITDNDFRYLRTQYRTKRTGGKQQDILINFSKSASKKYSKAQLKEFIDKLQKADK